MPCFLILLGSLFALGCVGNVGCASRTVYQPAADREGIGGVFRAHLRDFEPCYELAIEERPGARGKAVVEFQVGEDGAPRGLKFKEIDPSLRGGEICMLERIQALRFPKPDAGEEVVVIYPLYFSENGKFGSDSGKGL